ncbi:MAG: hypothetical protein LBJ07_04100 [Actinomycetes bacterium]|jgi:hypothetical protein|nr:hypothetical protein [Actinomycetes bacterium]
MDTVITDKRPEDTAGYCVYCNRIVARDEAAGCARAGHAPDAVRGLLDLQSGGSLPTPLPRMNWAAALMPPVWGVAHGAWAGVLAFPLWLFLDSALQAAAHMPATVPTTGHIIVWSGASVLALGTIAFMYWFGFRGWGVAFRRRYDTGLGVLPYPQFLKQERRWAWLCVPLFIVVMALAIAWWLR